MLAARTLEDADALTVAEQGFVEVVDAARVLGYLPPGPQDRWWDIHNPPDCGALALLASHLSSISLKHALLFTRAWRVKRSTGSFLCSDQDFSRHRMKNAAGNTRILKDGVLVPGTRQQEHSCAHVCFLLKNSVATYSLFYHVLMRK